MPLNTYSDLLVETLAYLRRPGDQLLTPLVPDWVRLLEERLMFGREKRGDADRPAYPSTQLRIRSMEQTVPVPVGMTHVTAGGTVTGTPNAIQVSYVPAVTAMTAGDLYQFIPAAPNTGAVTLQVNALPAGALLQRSAMSSFVGGELVAGATYQAYWNGLSFVLMPGSAHCPLPPDYLEMRSCYIDLAKRQSLDYLTPDQMNQEYPFADIQTPKAFTIENDAIRFAPAPDTTYYFWMDYYIRFKALSLGLGNWIFTNAPSIYLYGTAMEGALYIYDYKRADYLYSMFLSSNDGLQTQDEGDRHSGRVLRVMSDTGAP